MLVHHCTTAVTSSAKVNSAPYPPWEDKFLPHTA